MDGREMNCRHFLRVDELHSAYSSAVPMSSFRSTQEVPAIRSGLLPKGIRREFTRCSENLDAQTCRAGSESVIMMVHMLSSSTGNNSCTRHDLPGMRGTRLQQG